MSPKKASSYIRVDELLSQKYIFMYILHQAIQQKQTIILGLSKEYPFLVMIVEGGGGKGEKGGGAILMKTRK